MSFTNRDYENLEQLMNEKPENRELIEKLLESHQYTISKISHEIRNPLALVYSTLQLIESQHPEAKSFKHWNDMREDIEFMNSLLLELSTYNNGERLNLQPVCAYDFLSHICLSFASSCVDTEIEFTSKIDKNLPNIFCDRIKLHEVVLNLLQNAFDAVTPAGSIRLEAYIENNMLKIVISDTGCGISPEQLDEIFNAFFTSKSGGTGLGLAIAKRVITAHQGSVSVKSELHKGSKFTISLPVG